jgi:glucosamine-6-phosphate deaminase
MQDRVIARTGIRTAHLIDGTGKPGAVISALTQELRSAPIDLAITGIGENGHLAFNEPPADFSTTEAFVVVELDETSRRQQVGEDWFARVEDVPTHAITMTVPEVLKARHIVCLVHGTRKARAVSACFNTAATPMAPASALTSHPRATVYLDTDAASLLLPTTATTRG